MKIIENTKLNESYYKINHSSGLSIYLYPKKDYTSAFAMIGTNYGSIDIKFKKDGEAEMQTVPAGVAHFLEHKLFENEDGDAFSKYAKTGASANAFTSFDRTCYLFSTTDNFEDAFKILVSFVTSPYFTKETVEKEQGIISQEISMYDDDPNWRVYFNLLGSLYHNHPVKIDIAGSKESISEITPEILYTCYNDFYNLNNMALSVVGNIDKDKILSICDELLKKNEEIKIIKEKIEEPESAKQSYIEQSLEVAAPLFIYGYKINSDEEYMNSKDMLLMSIITNIITGKTSKLYTSLLEDGLINPSFGGEIDEGRTFQLVMFSGESKDPKTVKDKIKAEIDRLKEIGINEEDFEVSKKEMYGNIIKSFNDLSFIATGLISNHFEKADIYDAFNDIKKITLEGANELLNKVFVEENSALSVINPA